MTDDGDRLESNRTSTPRVLLALARGRAGKLGVAAIFDQGLFSLTNFLTAVFLGRWSGPSELGSYALAFSLIMLSICLMRALLISPFVVVHGALDEPQLKSMRTTLLVATVCLGALLAGVAWFVWLTTGTALALAMVLSLPAGLMRDFGRRLAIAELNVPKAIALDLAIAVLQLSAILALHRQGSLSAMTALVVCGAVWLVVSVWGLLHSRTNYQLATFSFQRDFLKLWPVGRWIGTAQLISTTQAFVMPWIMAIAHSMTLAGIYAACWTIVQVASPAIEGLGNVLSPALARSAADQRWGDLRAKVRAATCVFACLMGGMLLAIFLIGTNTLVFLYGESYRDSYTILILLTLAATTFNIGIPASKALTQLGRASVNCWVALLSLVLTVVVAIPMLLWLGESGAAWGLIAGGLVALLCRWFALQQTEMNRPGQPTRLVSPPSVSVSASPPGGRS